MRHPRRSQLKLVEAGNKKVSGSNPIDAGSFVSKASIADIAVWVNSSLDNLQVLTQLLPILEAKKKKGVQCERVGGGGKGFN